MSINIPQPQTTGPARGSISAAELALAEEMAYREEALALARARGRRRARSERLAGELGLSLADVLGRKG